jgi:hypothetical protein
MAINDKLGKVCEESVTVHVQACAKVLRKRTKILRKFNGGVANSPTK